MIGYCLGYRELDVEEPLRELHVGTAALGCPSERSSTLLLAEASKINKGRPNMIPHKTQERCHPGRSGAKASAVESLPRASEARRGGPAFFCTHWNRPFNPSTNRLAFLCLCSLLALSAACNRAPSQPASANSSTPKRYQLKGKIISIDKTTATASISNEPIPNFMDPMVMSYTIKPASMLDQLQPGDAITAEVVVQPDNTYWLENVKVTAHGLVSGNGLSRAAKANVQSGL